MDLEELLRAARDGEPGAWDALHVPLSRELRRQLSRWFKDDQLEDMTVEVVAVVFERLPGFVPDKSLRAWIRGIARNCAADELRRKYAMADLMRDLGHEPSPTQTSMDTKLLEQRLGRLLEEELAKLPPKLREVLEHGWRDGDDEELAAREGIGVGAIRTRRHRARKMLVRGIEGRLAEEARLAEGRQLVELARPVVEDTSTSSASPV